MCTYSGYPSFPTSSVMKMPKKSAMMPSIASSLRQEGYQTHYLYGGDINFTNMRGYLIATGWEQLTWKADYTLTEQNTAEWGVRDGITFETLYQMITRKHASPFLFGFSTLSTHQPWDVPIHQYDDEILNAFYYLDQCIGDFVERLRKTPEWNNLLLIFLPDHSMDFGDCVETVQLRNKIPMVWARWRRQRATTHRSHLQPDRPGCHTAGTDETALRQVPLESRRTEQRIPISLRRT